MVGRPGRPCCTCSRSRSPGPSVRRERFLAERYSAVGRGAAIPANGPEPRSPVPPTLATTHTPTARRQEHLAARSSSWGGRRRTG